MHQSWRVWGLGWWGSARSSGGPRAGRWVPVFGLLVGLAGVAAVWLPQPAHAAGPRSAWVWPLAGQPALVRGFDPPATAYGAGHRGVDLGSAAGAPVRAAGAGRVSYAGLLAGRGVVVVVHGTLRTTYEPVTAQVRVGQAVAAGQPLGWLGAGHCAPSCLHWGLLRGATYLNPLLVLAPAQARLLPVSTAGSGHPAPGAAPTGRVSAGQSPVGAERPAAAATAATPSKETRLALRGHDRPLGAGAALALVAGLALLVRRPRPRPPSEPVPATRAGANLPPVPVTPEPDAGRTVDLGNERARRRSG